MESDTFEVKNNLQHLLFITVKFNYIWVWGFGEPWPSPQYIPVSYV